MDQPIQYGHILHSRLFLSEYNRIQNIYAIICCIKEYIKLYWKKYSKEDKKKYSKYRKVDVKESEIGTKLGVLDVNGFILENNREYRYLTKCFSEYSRLCTIYEDDDDNFIEPSISKIYECSSYKEILMTLLLENTIKKLNELKEKTKISSKKFNIDETDYIYYKMDFIVDFKKVRKEIKGFYDLNKSLTSVERDFIFSL